MHMDTVMDKGASAAPTPWQITRRPIAVVDDSFDDQLMMRRELSFLFGDMPVITFHSGSGLFAYLLDHRREHEKPWLVLLDIHMTDMNGLRTLELLRQREDYADIPVLVISQTDNEAEIQSALKKGARGFMHKPLSRWDFVQILNGKETRPSRDVNVTGALM